MGKLRDNLNLIFSNLLFGANFSIYVSLVRNWFDFRQLFLLQVGAAALFSSLSRCCRPARPVCAGPI